MLKIADRRADDLGKKIALEKMNAESLKFAADSFDTVVDTLGLCTYDNPLEVLSQMRRACKPDGKIILLEHGKGSYSLIEKIQKLVEPRHFKKLGCRLTRDYKKLINEANLSILEEGRHLGGIIYTFILNPNKDPNYSR